MGAAPHNALRDATAARSRGPPFAAGADRQWFAGVAVCAGRVETVAIRDAWWWLWLKSAGRSQWDCNGIQPWVVSMATMRHHPDAAESSMCRLELEPRVLRSAHRIWLKGFLQEPRNGPADPLTCQDSIPRMEHLPYYPALVSPKTSSTARDRSQLAIQLALLRALKRQTSASRRPLSSPRPPAAHMGRVSRCQAQSHSKRDLSRELEGGILARS